jgi:hypothetical protein
VAAYGDQSDSNEDIRNKKHKVSHESMELLGQMTEPQHNVPSNICFDGTKVSVSSDKCQQRPSSQSSQFIAGSGISNGPRGVRTRNKYKLKLALSEGFQLKDNRLIMEQKVQPEPSSSKMILKEPLDASSTDYDARCNSTANDLGDPRSSAATVSNLHKSTVKFDKDSSRMHVFCLEHAVEVEKQLRTIGGANVILLCRQGQSSSFLLQSMFFKKGAYPGLCIEEMLMASSFHSSSAFSLLNPIFFEPAVSSLVLHIPSIIEQWFILIILEYVNARAIQDMLLGCPFFLLNSILHFHQLWLCH